MSNFPVTLEKTSEVLMSTYNKITSFPLSMGVNLKSKLRFIFSIILVLCFFANTSLYGETVGPSSASDGIGQDQLDTCSNIVPPKYKCGEKCVVIDGKEVWLEYCSKIGSIIDYVSFNHIHHASDYSVGSAASNCSPCGASALGSSAIESVQLQRYHRFRDMTEHSSFSPGVFQKYDISLRFAYEEVIKERQIYLFDPSTMARYVFIDENDDGVYLDPSHNSYKNITLYTGPDGTGAEISDYSQAQSAVLTTHNNHKWLFSLHNLSATAPAPWYDQDLGKPDYSGFAQWFNSTSGVLAGGGQLNNKKVDEGRSIYQGIDGDGALTVAVDGFTTPRGLDEERTKSSAQGMASIRAGLDAGSIMASVGIRKDGKVAFITRAGADADRETILITPATAATHVRIERAGTIISGFYSSDNANTWISAGNIDLSTLGSVAYFSFAATGDDKRVVTQVQFSDLAVTGNQAALASWPVQNGISPLSEAAATNGDWVGRLESQLDRNAYGINLTYKTWTTAELLAAPDRIWQLDTVADNNGRILTYHYHPNQIAGQWAVSSVDLPNGSSTVYAYANGQLSQVDHADGSQSTFTITDDAVSQCQIMQYDDAAAEGTHRRKSVYLSNNHREQRDSARTLYNNVINQSSMLVRLILNG